MTNSMSPYFGVFWWGTVFHGPFVPIKRNLNWNISYNDISGYSVLPTLMKFVSTWPCFLVHKARPIKTFFRVWCSRTWLASTPFGWIGTCTVRLSYRPTSVPDLINALEAAARFHYFVNCLSSRVMAVITVKTKPTPYKWTWFLSESSTTT